MRVIIFITVIAGLLGCAQLHHVQVGEIESSPRFVQKPFEIKISEMGLDLNQVNDIIQATGKGKAQDDANNIASFIALFQMGPTTGKPVYVKDYAKNLIQLLYEKCPSGKVTGLLSVRESREYPAISGEIVKVTGFCLIPKGA